MVSLNSFGVLGIYRGLFYLEKLYLYCMIIDIYEDLWLRLSQYVAKYQSGAQVVATFNGALSEVQNEVFSMLSPYYSNNEKVRSILAVWVKSLNATSTSGGVYAIPSSPTDPQFDRVISLGVTDTASPPNILYAITPALEGEVVYNPRIPQRQPNLAKKQVQYLVDAPTTLNFFPKTTIPFLMYYLAFPDEASIAFTYTETDDEDIMTYDPTNSVQLKWTKDARNLILYKMLEKYGVTVREQLLEAYSQLGLNELLSQPNNGGKQ